MKLLLPLLSSILLALTACSQGESRTDTSPKSKATAAELQSLETAYFASGCFWCVEAVFESVEGVREAVSGYSGGSEVNPTYTAVSRGQTSHAEAVKVYYDPAVVSFETLVKVFFASQDPTTKNRQGPDAGPQYRSVAFYKNKAEKEIIESAIKTLNDMIYDGKIVTEVTPFKIFYNAEDYHQDYEANNPNNPYVRQVSIPRLNRFKAKHPELLKKNHH